MQENYSITRAYLELHFSVILWGFTGILGRLITLNSTVLVWYRMLFTVISFLVLSHLFSQLRQMPRKTLLQLLGTGCIVALHWVTFYGSIHLSNVSVAVGCLATTSLFTSFLEPLVTKKKINWLEVLIGVFVSLGLGIMFFYGQKFTSGIIIGLISAVLAGTFTTLNKVMIDKKAPPAKAMSFLEMTGGWLLLCFFLPFLPKILPEARFVPSQQDLIWLLILSLVCTTLPFILSLRSLKKLSAFNSVLAINMEPIYSIILAIFIFRENEELNWRFYLGTGIVILSVFIYPVIQNIRRKRKAKNYSHP